ncbi:MAG: glycosyltransferase, partial [Pseudomonadota bacterium]
MSTESPVIVVSSLFFYREDLGEVFLAKLWPQLVSAAEAAAYRIRLKVTLNYPASPGYATRLARVCETAPRSGEAMVEIISRGWNAGFGAGHNAAFARDHSDFFVVLNSDLFCEQSDWLAGMIGAFADPAVALVGAAENASVLRRSDGCGLPAPTPDAFDFVDGSLLAFRSTDARCLGLFHPDYRNFYFEDSDLCLRYRQAGRKVTAISLPHQHLRYGSTMLVPRRVIRRILDDNRGAFFARWGDFM